MPKGASPLQVYVVEDSEIILRLLASAIESVGGEVIGYSGDAEQAIHELESLKPHLILIDLMLASGTGFDVLEARQAGSIGRNAIAVVFTNHLSAENRARSLELGASYMFDKSTEGRQALELIYTMAAKRQNQQAGPELERPERNGEP